MSAGERAGTPAEIRDRKVGVRVTSAMYERMEALCGMYGVSLSAMAAMAIGQWVTTHERQVRLQGEIVDLMVQEVGSGFRELIKDQAVEEITPKVAGFIQQHLGMTAT